jgi:hypothetical protein
MTDGQLAIDEQLEGRIERLYPEELIDGKTYEPTLDYARLGKQMKAVYSLMRDGQWRTLRQIADLVEAPEASVSARLRDLRKRKFGAFTVERARAVSGLHWYRLVVDAPQRTE